MSKFKEGDRVLITPDYTSLYRSPIQPLAKGDITEVDESDDTCKVRINGYTDWIDFKYISKYGKLGISDLLMALYENGGSWDGWEWYDGQRGCWSPCSISENPFSGLEFRMSDRPWATYSKNFEGE